MSSDTTASALTVLFFLLAVHDSYQKKLREEIDISFQEKTYNCAKPEPLLDGIISEALRLFPPVTFGSQRVIPEPGMTIGDVDIPPDTVVSLAMYQIQRGKFQSHRLL